MQFPGIIKEEKQPFIQLLLLCLYVFVGLIVGALIGFVIALIVYGFGLITDLTWVTGQNPKYVGALKIVLAGQSIGMFLLPAWALSLTEGIKISKFYGTGAPKLNLLLLVFLLMLCAMPIMGLIAELNAEMRLPAFLKDIENWMRQKEDEALRITKALLNTAGIGEMLVNLLVIAVLPAVCEEFAFRGALQRTVLRMGKNPHVAIWITAIIFSGIHAQFFGFFPRLFLGAAFGYIYFWTGNIWYSVFAHFLNNAYVVVVSFYLTKNHIPIEKADELNVAWYGYVLSAILTIVLFKFLKDKTSPNAIRHTPS